MKLVLATLDIYPINVDQWTLLDPLRILLSSVA